MATIKEALLETNPWWGGDFHVEYKDREIYEQIRKFMPMRHIIAFTGLRRVGKTTIMHKIVADAIEKGMPSRDIAYFSFDNFRDVEIAGIIKEYENIMEKDASKGRHIFLFDEVQKVSNWEEQIKRIYDILGKSSKIIISGSESLFIKKGSKEALAGRLFEFKVETLSFREFLCFRGIEYAPIGLHEKKLSALFDNFAATMGFPELVDVTDKEIIKKYVREGIVEKVIYRDIPQMFEIRDISLLESLLRIIMEEPGQIIEISSLAQELNASRQTISNYLSYLEESFLVKKLYNYSRNRRKTERKLKKYYPAAVSTDLLFRDDDYSRSKVFEWLVSRELDAEYFWRDPYKNEVDIVLGGKEPVPVEIKYGKISTGGLEAFAKKFGTTKAFIISRREEGSRKIGSLAVKIIPAYKYLLVTTSK